MRKKILIKGGERFGKLTIIKEIEPYISPSGKTRKRRVLCQCDCGNKTKVIYDNLKYGRTKSCGHLIKKHKHGMTKTAFYKVWQNIRQRCNDKNTIYYKNYGERGIKNEWKSFEEFKKDMYKSYVKHYKKYGNNTTIDRINNNGNYCKENCRWATWEEQNNNRRINIPITYQNTTLNLQQWARKMNMSFYKTKMFFKEKALIF